MTTWCDDELCLSIAMALSRSRRSRAVLSVTVFTAGWSLSRLWTISSGRTGASQRARRRREGPASEAHKMTGVSGPRDWCPTLLIISRRSSWGSRSTTTVRVRFEFQKAAAPTDLRLAISLLASRFGLCPASLASASSRRNCLQS